MTLDAYFAVTPRAHFAMHDIPQQKHDYYAADVSPFSHYHAHDFTGVLAILDEYFGI